MFPGQDQQISDPDGEERLIRIDAQQENSKSDHAKDNGPGR